MDFFDANKSIVENAADLATTFSVFALIYFGFKGLKQLKLSKKANKQAVRLQRANIAYLHCEKYTEAIAKEIETIQHLYETHDINISILERDTFQSSVLKHADFGPEYNQQFFKVIDCIKQSRDFNGAVDKAANLLENFSTPIIHQTADQEICFSQASLLFDGFCKLLAPYFHFATDVVSHPLAFESVRKLYARWTVRVASMKQIHENLIEEV